MGFFLDRLEKPMETRMSDSISFGFSRGFAGNRLKKPTVERLCWRMTLSMEYGQNGTVFIVLACHTWCFWIPNRPISIHCFIRQQSLERSAWVVRAPERTHLLDSLVPFSAMNCGAAAINHAL
jgi:hypothetical protein